MNKNFLFFVLASALLVLSVITICLAPIINGYGNIDVSPPNNNVFDSWNVANCQMLDDDYKYDKDRGHYNSQSAQEKQDKDKIKECKRHKVMHGLEFAALITDIVLGFICTFLGLIHYVEQGKPFETTSGLIGIASGGIATVLTVVYVIYSGIIFNNEPIREIEILYENKALFHWDGSKYVYNYEFQKLEKDLDVKFIKYKDLGKKQYNYDSELYQISKDQDSEYSKCNSLSFTGLYEDDIRGSNTKIRYSINPEKYCDYFWKGNERNDKDINKFLYDRWLTTLILSCLICVCGIGVAIFGFLLFSGKSSS